MAARPTPRCPGVMATQGLVVGITESSLHWPVRTGDHRLWAQVVAHLSELVSIEVIADDAAPSARPHVWLAAGLAPLPEVTGPRVTEIHEVPLSDAGSLHTLERAHWSFEPHLRHAVDASVAVITPSEHSKLQLVERFGTPPWKVHAIHLGVDHAVFLPDSTRSLEVLTRHGVPSDRPYILCVSTVHPRKNLEALRGAVAGLARRGLPHILVVVAAMSHGFPNAREHERRMTRDIDGASGRLFRVHDPGDDELAALMSGAAVFCLPSLMEGFGLPVVEAMACGAPCVVSRRGSLPEVVGDAAIICEPDAEALEEALARVLVDNRLQSDLRDRGMRRAAVFSWRRVASAWLAVLRAAAR
jgi:glycosyltransferase involved in cell wall biosynthesis